MNRQPRIKVSANGRYLITEDGEPFLWLGDTAWELFHRLTYEEVERYLHNRASKGFNVIQAVVLAELDGLNVPNRYGERPLLDNDPARPNERYFDFVADIIRRAAEQGLYVGLLPTWGDKVTKMWGIGPQIFTAKNAAAYGQYLAQRFSKFTNVLWINGGDRPVVSDNGREDYRPVWRALAQGILSTDPQAFITFHISGHHETGTYLHDESWLHMNSLQSGHGSGRDTPTAWEFITRDYQLIPAKPVLDLEPCYEDHPVSPWPMWDPEKGYFRDYDVRRQVYRSLFAGGCGVTYGHHFVWQMWDQRREPQNNGDELIPWHKALDRPAAAQMKYLKELILSRPYFDRIPDQTIIKSAIGEGKTHIRATRDRNGRNAFVYLPVNQPVTVRLGWLQERTAQLSWFDPRTGQITVAGSAIGASEVSCRPPNKGR